ncbi:class I SAM-dependent methyltransferase [Pseudidiomarina sp. 1APP75-27a]|uniref:class I SAM-dependent methyltransferase n=1 Tax=Pseudidiomarina terrestris TaxID=2820060 RepID=UPI002B052762|nr:methyltransferase [Pseudidiomarina sp. 1APP75-27a]MEA3587957.1 class I SAM-dependent methyltransferase [Pseudidiomarina sp. 1APP75-27a]
MKNFFALVTMTASLFMLAACSDSGPSSEAASDGMTLEQAVNENPARDASNLERDVYRNPIETLRFFNVQPDMTVVEIWPGGGWYTEILAPYLKENGKLYAAHFAQSETRDYYVNSREQFAERVANDPAFSAVVMTEFAPNGDSEIAPPGSADRVLTFRNLHNWYMNGGIEAVQSAFESFYTALKPGGILGVVDHRLPADRPDAHMESSGYMKESVAIEAAKAAGFVFVDSSDVNANPLDTADYPRGVWTLPPTLGLGEEDLQRYIDIGESDRFTLKFKKPESS